MASKLNMKLTLDATLMVLHMRSAILQKFVVSYEDSKTGVRNVLFHPLPDF
jgi:hypothetical protein